MILSILRELDVEIYFLLKEHDIMVRKIGMEELSLTVDETVTLEDMHQIINLASGLDGVTVV